jgi:adenylosuccinate synthase
MFSMTVTSVLGAQWGDEGVERVVDGLAGGDRTASRGIPPQAGEHGAWLKIGCDKVRDDRL